MEVASSSSIRCRSAVTLTGMKVPAAAAGAAAGGVPAPQGASLSIYVTAHSNRGDRIPWPSCRTWLVAHVVDQVPGALCAGLHKVELLQRRSVCAHAAQERNIDRHVRPCGSGEHLPVALPGGALHANSGN